MGPFGGEKHMAETARLEDDYLDLDGHIDGKVTRGGLHLVQNKAGEITLTPRAQFELLEWLYARRIALYLVTHPRRRRSDIPAWIAQNDQKARGGDGGETETKQL